MKLIISLLAISLFVGCAESTQEVEAKKATADAEREAKFSTFQSFTDNYFSGWKVIAIRKDDADLSGEGEKNFYYVILTKDKSDIWKL